MSFLQDTVTDTTSWKGGGAKGGGNSGGDGGTDGGDGVDGGESGDGGDSGSMFGGAKGGGVGGTDNPLWIDQKYKAYEEQELTMTVFSDQDNSVISGNGGSGNSQSR